MNLFLIEFTYTLYCGGWESDVTSVLVAANTYNEACNKIAKNYEDARDFKNRTLGTIIIK